MGFTITGENIKVWRNDDKGFPRYSIYISKKNESGNWDKAYQTVKFRKEVEVSNGATINITNAFPVLTIWKDGSKHIDWFIDKFDTVDGGSPIYEDYDSFDAAEKEVNDELKRIGQSAFEENFSEDFISIFGRNYL